MDKDVVRGIVTSLFAFGFVLIGVLEGIGEAKMPTWYLATGGPIIVWWFAETIVTRIKAWRRK
ncbi:MAG: hypothetical protein Q8M94_12110 [Ignavibacteria bacterium]|nr:hypothetical protein [Ignavibacteria bacterium]